MATVDVPKFSGPLTAIALTDWLERCDKKFRTYNSQTSTPLKDEAKVNYAIDAIEDNDVTHDLVDWCVRNTNNTTWIAFTNAIKDEALPSDWLVRALEAFYTTKQNQGSATDYLRELEENRNVITKSGNTTLGYIDDSTCKYIMLFHAAPSIITEVMKDVDNGFDLFKASVHIIKEKIKTKEKSLAANNTTQSSSGTTQPTSTSTDPKTVVTGYYLFDLWRNSFGMTFFDMKDLPLNSNTLGPMTKITLWGNNDPNAHLFQGYSFEFQRFTISHLENQGIYPPMQNAKNELVLNNGEYITSVTVWGTNYSFHSSSWQALSSMIIVTSSGRTCTSPPTSASTSLKIDSRKTFDAPTGWRIIGFRGYVTAFDDSSVTGGKRYPVVALGAICSPLAVT